MKDEIKEILDKLKSDNYPFGIATIDINKLEDYITNLQKENERLKNEIKALLKENGNKEKVIIKQNNIINGMKKYINYNLDYWNKESSQRSSLIKDTLTNTLNTLRKLKGNDKDVKN